MRRQRVLGSSTHPCVFCVYRLSGDLPISLTSGPVWTRRRLNTARPPLQSAVGTVALNDANGAASRPTDDSTAYPGGLNSYSSLTSAERREKENRIRLRLDQERVQQERGGQLNVKSVPAQRTKINGVGRENGAGAAQGIVRRVQGGRQQWNRMHQNEGDPRSQGLRTGNGSDPFDGSREQSSQTSARNTKANDLQNGTQKYFRLSYNSRQQPQQGRDTFNGSAYRAVPLSPSDLPLKHNDAQVGEWLHLQRRNEESAVSSTLKINTQDDSLPKTPFNDTAEIDARFDEHKRRRDTTATATYPFKPSVIKNSNVPRASLRCARCLEPGHTALDCTGPINAKCSRCGQPGHSSNHCLQTVSHGNRNRGDADYVRETRPLVNWTMGRRRNEPEAARDKDDGLNRNIFDRTTYPSKSSDPSPEKEKTVQKEEDNEWPTSRATKSRRFRDDANEEEEEKSTSKRSHLARRGWLGEESTEPERFASKSTKVRRQGRRDLEEDDIDDEAHARRERKALEKAQRKAEREKEKAARKSEQGTPVNLPEFVSVSQLAQLLGVRYEAFVSRLERLGYDDVFPGKILNSETSGMIAMEYNFDPLFETSAAEKADEERDLKSRPEVDKTYLPIRPPVVTIMGHVDHGKTTILDFLRKSSVAAGEAGGITQHIGAFSVSLSSSGKTITFLDTPGHAAFLAMRQRGANVTDIVVLVVAADDSVKPQTLEALKHAQVAGVPIIVAINKVDKPEADVQRVKQDLARHGVEIEDFGGETQVVCVSGKTGEGMDELEENIVTLSEILDHRAEKDGLVEGWVLEATTKKSGRVATVLVRRGTLKPGAIIVAGKTWSRVRSLRNEAGLTVRDAGPGMPVEVDGWRDQPVAGDEVLQAPSEQKATSVISYRLEKEEREKTAQDMESINEARRLEQSKRRATDEDGRDEVETEPPQPEAEQPGHLSIPFIIKADVSGSVEAVSAYILTLSSPLIAPTILHSSVGSIHESDIELASAANGHIVSFNLPPDENMKGQAEARGVKVLENNIIYRVVDDVRAVLEDKLPPIVTQRVLGEAEIAAVFEIGVGGRKKMKIAGCKVRNGTVGKGSRVRVLRGTEKIYDGTVNSLKNVKKDVSEMRKGTECGMGFEAWEEFAAGDQIQTYEEISEKRRLQVQS